MVFPDGARWRQSQQGAVALGPSGLGCCLNVHRVCHHHRQQDDQRYSSLCLVARALWSSTLWRSSNAGVWWNTRAVPGHTAVQSSTCYTQAAPRFLWYGDIRWWSLGIDPWTLLLLVRGERGSACRLEGVFCVSCVTGTDYLSTGSQEPLLV